jgi:hypothetical protein
MQLEKGERANMCGSNELCVPGEYDQEASCATCDVPQVSNSSSGSSGSSYSNSSSSSASSSMRLPPQCVCAGGV